MGIHTPQHLREWISAQIQILSDWSKPLVREVGSDSQGAVDDGDADQGWSEPELNVYEDAAQIVRQASEYCLLFGLPDLYRECQVRTKMLAIPVAKELLGRCLQACDSLPATLTVAGPDPQNEELSAGTLSPICERAYRQYREAERHLGQGVKDGRAYQWAKTHRPAGEPALPPETTWKRYLRKGRQYYKTQKNSPRAGRGGRSIVRACDIERRQDDDDD
jgi:hypothetical protein